MTLAWNPRRPPDVADAAAKAAARRAPAKRPPVMSPVPPPGDPFSPWTQDQIDAEANARLDAQFATQADPIRRAMADALRRSQGAAGAKIGFTNAAQGELGKIGPELQAAYDEAQGQVGSIDGLSPEVAPVVGYDKAEIGGTGQAAASWAGQLGQIQGNLGQHELASLLNKSEQEQQDYEQQLIDLAHQKPELRGQILDELYKRELDKANLKLQQRAEAAQEQSLGIRAGDQNFNHALAIEKLKLAQNKQQASVDAAVAKGQQPNAALSGKYGYIVDANGQAILDAQGNKIRVVKTAGKGGTSFQKAVVDAKTLRGTPITYPGTRKIIIKPDYVHGTPGSTTIIKGKYIAAPGAKGVYSVPDPNHPGQFIRTTSNPAKAKTSATYTYQQAVEYLVNSRGLTAAQAQKALRAAGWIPPAGV